MKNKYWMMAVWFPKLLNTSFAMKNFVYEDIDSDNGLFPAYNAHKFIKNKFQINDLVIVNNWEISQDDYNLFLQNSPETEEGEYT